MVNYPGIAEGLGSTFAKTTECKWCERTTANLGTKMCDPCWELEWRIATQPLLAFKMLVHLRTKRKREELDKQESDKLRTEIEQAADRELMR